MHQLTIVVPVFNEEGNLLRLGEALRDYLKIAAVKTKVLYVNDGSTDGSQFLIQKLCDNQQDFGFIQLTKNEGLSAAIKVGFDYAHTELIGYMDADLQTSPTDFNSLLDHISEFDLVIGIRNNRQDAVFKKLISRISNKVRRLFTSDGIEDTGCPLKIIKSDVAKRIPMFRGLHRFLPAMVLLQNGRIKQIPVQHFPRQAGVSKFGLSKRFIAPIIDCFAYLWIKRRYISYEVSKKSDDII